jgi:hypothetical protein
MPLPYKDTALNADWAAPALGAAAVTPNDSTDLVVRPARSLFIGGAGNVAVITAAGDTVTFNGLAAGSILPVQVTRVLATGTTATNIIALY